MPATPRVFVSYARADGERFATDLVKRMQANEPEITVWQDRARMEGGKDFWHQITEALDEVRFLVIVMTPAAMESRVCRDEWRYARQQGVCVYPVQGAPNLDFTKLPRWMSSAHFFDLEKEWATFVNYLKSPCEANRVPFMAPHLPEGHVVRQNLLDRLVGFVRDDKSDPRPGVTALHGAGGFGKTTLATALCHHDDVVTAFGSGVLWATLGEMPDVLVQLTKLHRALADETPQFLDANEAAIALAGRLEKASCLLVVDDVWDESHLVHFRRAAKDCTWVVTTRDFKIAAGADNDIAVDEMSTPEAVEMLAASFEKPPTSPKSLEDLAARLGEWPLMLDLAGAQLRQRVKRKDTSDGAVRYVNEALDAGGVVAFDRKNADERNQAIAKTISVSLAHLDDDGDRERYHELATFPEDTEVPLAAVGVLWGLEEFATEKLIEDLDDLSLLHFDLRGRTARLHDVIGAYLAMRMSKSGRSQRSAFVARAALARDILQREQSRPSEVFSLAREGKLRKAEERLSLIDAEEEWHDLALLTAAWLAAEHDPDEAVAVRDRIAAKPRGIFPNGLEGWLTNLPAPGTPPPSNLPAPPDDGIVAEILERLGGGENVSAIEPLEQLSQMGDEAPAYLARIDGPPLVAYAMADPPKNTAALSKYIATLSVNQYEFYRNRSLSELLDPVLQSTDPDWVRERLVELVTGALEGIRNDFIESVPTALEAITSRARFESRLARAKLEAGKLGADRGDADSWSHHMRRYTALAEVDAIADGNKAEANKLLDEALALPRGFAGLRAKACLAVADARRICGATDDVVRAAVEAARAAAHNAQDAALCAYATARIHAMQKRWFGPIDELASVIERFVQDPEAAEFSSIHVVGETYSLRIPPKMPSPSELHIGDALRNIAWTYELPEQKLLEYNPQYTEADIAAQLPIGTEINIPDPELVPLLAAHFASETLVSGKLDQDQRVKALRMLVPVARTNPTAVDTICMFLLLAGPKPTPQELGQLERATNRRDAWIDKEKAK